TPEQVAHRAVYGFSTGGIMGPDTQKVEFFKKPSERVIIADPDQFDDQRGGKSGSGGRPIHVTQNVTIQGGTPSKESLAELRRQSALGFRDAARSVNGR
ncbi:hypothetical protein, partial [Mesorhizobium sp. P5_C1]